MTLMTAESIVELDLILEAVYEAAEKGKSVVEIDWFYGLHVYTQEQIIDHLQLSGYNVTFEHRRDDPVDLLKVAW